jgi:dihydrofolate synthase/folylpolyglutamate synthase
MAIRNGLLAAKLPGRFEQVSWRGRRFVLDGAHSSASIAGLLETLAARGQASITVIAGFLADKDVGGLVSQLAAATSHVYLTPLESPRSASTEALAGAATGLEDRVTLASSLDDALSQAVASTASTGTIVVTGSFPLVAAARVRLGIATSDS